MAHYIRPRTKKTGRRRAPTTTDLGSKAKLGMECDPAPDGSGCVTSSANMDSVIPQVIADLKASGFNPATHIVVLLETPDECGPVKIYKPTYDQALATITASQHDLTPILDRLHNEQLPPGYFWCYGVAPVAGTTRVTLCTLSLEDGSLLEDRA